MISPWVYTSLQIVIYFYFVNGSADVGRPLNSSINVEPCLCLMHYVMRKKDDKRLAHAL